MGKQVAQSGARDGRLRERVEPAVPRPGPRRHRLGRPLLLSIRRVRAFPSALVVLQTGRGVATETVSVKRRRNLRAFPESESHELQVLRRIGFLGQGARALPGHCRSRQARDPPRDPLGTGVARRLLAWGLSPERVCVIPNGIDAKEFRYDANLRRAVRKRLNIAIDTLVIGGVGRLELTKRFDLLVRVARDLPEATLLLVGDGSARAGLEALTRELGMSSRVIFTGATPDVRAMMCAMDVLASPSGSETFGLAILEALATGLPALYVSCPALDELRPECVPTARRVAADEEAFRAALQTELNAIQRRRSTRLAMSPALAPYGLANVGRSVQLLYEALLSSTRPLPIKSPNKIPSHSKERHV